MSIVLGYFHIGNDYIQDFLTNADISPKYVQYIFLYSINIKIYFVLL